MSQWGRTKCFTGPGFHCATSDALRERQCDSKRVLVCLHVCFRACLCVFVCPSGHKKSSWSISGVLQCDSSVPWCWCDTGDTQTPALRHKWRNSRARPQCSRDEHVCDQSQDRRAEGTADASVKAATHLMPCYFFYHSQCVSKWVTRRSAKKEGRQRLRLHSRPMWVLCRCHLKCHEKTLHVSIKITSRANWEKKSLGQIMQQILSDCRTIFWRNDYQEQQCEVILNNSNNNALRRCQKNVSYKKHDILYIFGVCHWASEWPKLLNSPSSTCGLFK